MMRNWLAVWITDARANIAAGRSEIVEKRYLPLAALVGTVFGVFVSFLLPIMATLIILAFGFLLGYAARSYVSYRRRLAYYQTRVDRL